jgi:hypothetical protein
MAGTLFNKCQSRLFQGHQQSREAADSKHPGATATSQPSISAKQAKLLKKRQEEEQWAVQDLNNRRAIALLDLETKRLAKQQALALQKENQLKALQDKERYH